MVLHTQGFAHLARLSPNSRDHWGVPTQISSRSTVPGGVPLVCVWFVCVIKVLRSKRSWN